MDEILRKAYAMGVISAEISAGANCWFEQCSTDALPGMRVQPDQFCARKLSRVCFKFNRTNY